MISWVLPERSLSILGACVVLAGAVTTSAGREPQNGRTWPPPVHRAPTSSPVLSPEDEMKTFFLPPGYRVELVASEPMIEEPVLVDFDLDGTAVGGGDARLHARHRRDGRT